MSKKDFIKLTYYSKRKGLGKIAAKAIIAANKELEDSASTLTLTIVEQDVLFSSDPVSDAEEKPHKGPISMSSMKVTLEPSAGEKLALCELGLISNNISTIADLPEGLREWVEGEEETLFEGLHISSTEDMVPFYRKHLCPDTVFSPSTEESLLDMIFGLMRMQEKTIRHLECGSCQD